MTEHSKISKIKEDNKILKEQAEGQISSAFSTKSSNEQQDKKKPPQPDNTKVNELQQQVDTLKDSLIRSIADSENLKKRHQKDVESMAKYGSTSLIKDLVEPFEQLFMALSIEIPEDLQNNNTVNSIVNGVNITRKAFEKAFEKHGLKRLYPKGEKFDHNFHEAISQVKQEGEKPDTVVNVMQAGYTLNDRVIKPAMVVVSI